MNPGARFRSQVCTTEVIVVRPADVVLCCGGHPMVALGTEPAHGLAITADRADGSQLGKRYTNADGTLEVLVTKPGSGTLSVAGERLTIRAAKPLPSSD